MTFRHRLTSDFLLFSHTTSTSFNTNTSWERKFQNIISTSIFKSLMSSWNFQANSEVIIGCKSSHGQHSCKKLVVLSATAVHHICEFKIMQYSKLINRGKITDETWNGAFQICLQFNKGNFKLSTKFLKIRKLAPAFVKSQQKKIVKQFRALYGYYTVQKE